MQGTDVQESTFRDEFYIYRQRIVMITYSQQPLVPDT